MQLAKSGLASRRAAKVDRSGLFRASSVIELSCGSGLSPPSSSPHAVRNMKEATSNKEASNLIVFIFFRR